MCPNIWLVVYCMQIIRLSTFRDILKRNYAIFTKIAQFWSCCDSDAAGGSFFPAREQSRASHGNQNKAN